MMVSVNAIVYNSCNADLSACGSYTMDSDLDCGGNWAFLAWSFDNFELDCQGHTITCDTVDCIDFYYNTNVTLKNCIIEGSDNSEFLQFYDVTDLILTNNQIIYNGTASDSSSILLALNDASSTSVNFSKNTITNLNGYAVEFNFDYYYSDFYFAENNITATESIYFRSQFESDFDITSNYSIGNYYTIPSYTCIDSNYDGYCDNSLVETPDTTEIRDNYPLSEYYWTPYVAPSPEASSSGGSKRRTTTPRESEVIEEPEPEEKTGWDGLSDSQKLIAVALGGVVIYSIFTAKPKPRRIKRRKK